MEHRSAKSLGSTVPEREAMDLLAAFWRDLGDEVARAKVQRQQIATHLGLAPSSVTAMFKSGTEGGNKTPPSWERVESIVRFCWAKRDPREFPGINSAAVTRVMKGMQDWDLDRWKGRHTILISDMKRMRAGADTSSRAAQLPVPAVPEVRSSLPPDAAAFTGRAGELGQITAAVAGAVGAGGVVTVGAIDGMPGVGKTALAVRVAHLLCDQFPDRQLFLNLHAHTPGKQPVRPEDALAGLLAATSVDPRYLPGDLDGLAGMWRDRMAGQRALLVLDNAASSSQVAPLLPGDGGCLVLVTSRRHLGDLPGAVTPVLLDTLSPRTAAEMFTRLAPRAAEFPGEVAKVVRLAGFLPLAISLLARVFDRHPSWTMANMVDETRAGLLTLTAEKHSIAAAFLMSYQHLYRGQQRNFCMLGLHPGTTIDSYAAAALTGTSLDEATAMLDGLHGEGLLTETGHRRYTMHDLLGRYARDLAAADTAADSHQALDRLLDYYQHSAALAEALLARQTRPGPAPTTPATLRVVPDLEDAGHALAWARANRASLLACLDHAIRTGQHARVIALTAGLAGILRHDGPWTDAITRHEAAIQAARNLGDQRGEAGALTYLGDMQRLTGDYPGAAQALEQALSIYRDLEDQRGQANALTYLGDVRSLTDDYRGAAQALEHALDIYRDLEDQLGQANALTELGDVRSLMGDYPRAARAQVQALDIYRGLGHRLGQARALTRLGDVRRLTGDYPGAAHALTGALDIFCDLGELLGQARALNRLGEVRRLTGDYPGAVQAQEQALGIYRDLGERLGQANALTALGVVWRLTGDCLGAVQAQEQALDIYRDLGDRGGQAEALNEIGILHRLSSELAQAKKCHHQALELARGIASSWDEANALAGLGRCDRAAGRTTDAGTRLQQALDIFQRIGAAEATSVAAELSAIPEAEPAAERN